MAGIHAIVGGGIGGTSTAYFLRQLLPNLDIHLFEAEDVGGRLKVVQVGEHSYEAGGAIIHPKNRYMLEMAKQMGLSHRPGLEFGKFGLYDGREMVFEESNVAPFTTLKLLWRYGLSSLWSSRSMTQKKLDQFDRIYKLQKGGHSYDSVAKLLDAVNPDFVQDTQTLAKDGLLQEGLSPLLVNEFVESLVRVNYGQSVDTVHKLLAFVSLAAADSDIWSVKDGNYKVAKHLLEASKARFIPSRVHSVEWTSDKKHYVVTSERTNETYDAVVLASPVTADYKSVIRLPNDLDHPVIPKKMKRLEVTFVQGHVNRSYFGETKESTVEEIITTNSKHTSFFLLGRVYPVDGTMALDTEPVYKIFSSEQLPDSTLDTLFTTRDQIVRKSWFAYPLYSYKQPVTESFVLSPGLYYLNAIEQAASAMEMSAIGAKNVALLTCKHLISLGASSKLGSEHTPDKEDHVKQEL